MTAESASLRDWHRLFGLLLADFFTDSPFVVEVERDLSEQQQFLDVVIVRRRPGKFHGRLPDGLSSLMGHNLITFKSHHEALDAWAMKELIGHYVTYRQLISASTRALLPEDRFRLYAVSVCARFPQNLSEQVPWQQRQAGVYHCCWGTDEVHVIVAGELPLEAHNAPLHLFSAAAERIGFGSRTYEKRSEKTSLLLRQLLDRLSGEGVTMSYTMEDFVRGFMREKFSQLTPKEQNEFLDSLPVEKRLAGLSPEQIRAYLDRIAAAEAGRGRKPRRKKS